MKASLTRRSAASTLLFLCVIAAVIAVLFSRMGGGVPRLNTLIVGGLIVAAVLISWTLPRRGNTPAHHARRDDPPRYH
ncbi:MAG: hypothetical protein ACF8SC_07000 [Phycisphaerales bacterium JB037]